MCLFIVVLYLQRSQSLLFSFSSLGKHQSAVSVSDSGAELQFLFFAPQVLDTWDKNEMCKKDQYCSESCLKYYTLI